MNRTIITILSITILAATSFAQGHQGAMGVWVLNVEKSVFTPGPKPRQQRSTFTQMPDGKVKIENESIDTAGRASHREMVSAFDGRPETRAGSGLPTTRAYRWLDDLNFEFEETINGQRSVIGRTTMSGDGRVRTLTVDGTRGGQPVHNVEVYERQ